MQTAGPFDDLTEADLELPPQETPFSDPRLAVGPKAFAGTGRQIGKAGRKIDGARAPKDSSIAATGGKQQVVDNGVPSETAVALKERTLRTIHHRGRLDREHAHWVHKNIDGACEYAHPFIALHQRFVPISNRRSHRTTPQAPTKQKKLLS